MYFNTDFHRLVFQMENRPSTLNLGCYIGFLAANHPQDMGVTSGN